MSIYLDVCKLRIANADKAEAGMKNDCQYHTLDSFENVLELIKTENARKVLDMHFVIYDEIGYPQYYGGVGLPAIWNSMKQHGSISCVDVLNIINGRFHIVRRYGKIPNKSVYLRWQIDGVKRLAIKDGKPIINLITDPNKSCQDMVFNQVPIGTTIYKVFKSAGFTMYSRSTVTRKGRPNQTVDISGDDLFNDIWGLEATSAELKASMIRFLLNDYIDMDILVKRTARSTPS